MPNETVASAVRYTPFGTPIRKVNPVDCSYHMLAQFSVEIDKETGSTRPVKKDPIDLDKLIQSYEKECGMAQAQLLLSRGLASPEDFAAKPGNVDISDLPDNLNDAYRANLANKEISAKADLSQFKTDVDIQKYVEAQVKAQLEALEKKKAATTEVKDNA